MNVDKQYQREKCKERPREMDIIIFGMIGPKHSEGPAGEYVKVTGMENAVEKEGTDH